MGEKVIHLIAHGVQEEKGRSEDMEGGWAQKNFSITSKNKLNGKEGWRELGI